MVEDLSRTWVFAVRRDAENDPMYAVLNCRSVAAAIADTSAAAGNVGTAAPAPALLLLLCCS
jgi:hypothetical protein